MKNKQIHTARGAALNTLDQVLQNGGLFQSAAESESQEQPAERSRQTLGYQSGLTAQANPGILAGVFY